MRDTDGARHGCSGNRHVLPGQLPAPVAGPRVQTIFVLRACASVVDSSSETSSSALTANADRKSAGGGSRCLVVSAPRVLRGAKPGPRSHAKDR